MATPTSEAASSTDRSARTSWTTWRDSRFSSSRRSTAASSGRPTPPSDDLRGGKARHPLDLRRGLPYLVRVTGIGGRLIGTWRSQRWEGTMSRQLASISFGILLVCSLPAAGLCLEGGYASLTSVPQGGSIDLRISTSTPTYSLAI